MKLSQIYLTLILFFSIQTLSATDTPLWLRYPAISPNGQSILFNYKGNIYKVSAKGGVATALTTNPAYDYQAVWSPDGSKIAFASNRNGNFDIFVMDANGGNIKRLTYYSNNEVPSCFTPDGKNIVFSAIIQDAGSSIMFPSKVLPELYKVPINGGATMQILSSPAIDAAYTTNGAYIYYTDRKGYEDPWRKHHVSSIARDIWQYDTKLKKHKKITQFQGEDRNALQSSLNPNTLYYLSEQFGSNFNVCKLDLSNNSVSQLTKFEHHPVRFLSKSDNDKLCFSYNGEIYTVKDGEQPQKVNISIFADKSFNEQQYMKLHDKISELAVSPDGKELAFILHGEVFVTSSKYKTTKRITNTPEQERSVSFSNDGKALLYAGERNGSWNIYQTRLANKDEKYFCTSTILKEELILANAEETFQPSYSPDGKEVAFLANRTALKVINLATKKVRTITDGTSSYSYSDGDQWYQWSPDSKWFAVQYSDNHLFRGDIAIIKADGNDKLHRLAASGYNDAVPKWGMKGTMIYWQTDRQGYRSHGSWGAERDVYAIFLTQEAYDRFKLNEEDYTILTGDDEEDKSDKKNDENKEEKKKHKKEKIQEIKIDWEGIDDRIARLTIHSSDLSDALIGNKGKKLFYLSKFEKGYDLWISNLRKKEAKVLLKLKGYGDKLQTDSMGKKLFLISEGKIISVNTKDFKKTDVPYDASMILDKQKEYAYFFEHIWRQTLRKWYNPNMHNVDWKFYKNAYKRFLPYIDNHFDFAEMMSEMLGELNGSHTGCRYYPNVANADQTASLGILIDWNYKGKGVRIGEIPDKSPLRKAKSKAKTGIIINKINGKTIETNNDYWKYLNHEVGKAILVSFLDEKTGKTWNELVKPVNIADETELLYERWVKNCRKTVDKLSNGQIGYTHVKAMNSPSFRKVYSDVLGINAHKKALIVDTRFNGGGWLHDDLATLLSGSEYVSFYPRGVKQGWDPMHKWTKPSVVLMSEGNYSDAHAFPYVYKTLKIGKLIGMPVPGTMTAVWWERLHDGKLVFGIPQVGSLDVNGKYLENQQLEPDIKQANEYEKANAGEDQQLKKAVEELTKGQL